ncbi:hypothetical protein ABW20_dc0106126 [Dactylellina cionopaga]|nr:hypothetical protein ABW20_dc0106126 [Dactylellina cionopaga]
MDLDTEIQVTTSQEHNLLTLPTELILQILVNAHWSDYYALCRTSKLLCNLVNVPNSMASLRHGYLPPFSSTAADSSADPPLKIHQIFSCTSYRNGNPYYTISVPTEPNANGGGLCTRKISVDSSLFREDSFSEPKCYKIVISWAHVDTPNQPNGERSGMSNASLSPAPQTGALYVNNLIVGTGQEEMSSIMDRISTDNAGDDFMDDEMAETRDDEGFMFYITVRDVFEAFERDHPDLSKRRGGEARILGFHHVFHPSAGTRGGSHFEVRWTWVNDGEKE